MTSSNVHQVALFAVGTAVFAGLGLSACVNPEVRCSDEPTAPGCAGDAASAPDGGVRLDGGEADAEPDDAGEPSDGGRDAAASDAGPCEGGCDGGYCVDGSCVACTDATGDCEDPTPHCSDEGACVECRDDGDCDGLTPICDAGTCRRCNENSECAARTATPTCHEESGECVECTYDDETLCGTDVCNVLERTCETGTEEESAGACEACVSDRQCESGQLCVPQYFMGALVDYFCAWRRDAAPSMNCLNVPPYGEVQTPARASLGQVTTDVCVLALSTCEAHDDFRSQGCRVGDTLSDPVADATCGAADHADGFCAQRAAGSPPTNQCTVECTGFSDCPCTGISCLSQYDCDGGACSFARTCVVATGVCT